VLLTGYSKMEFDDKIWQLQKVSQSTLIGSQSRNNTRAKERRNAQELLLKVIAKKHPDWLNASTDSTEESSIIQISQNACQLLLDEVERSKNSDTQYKFMHNFLCDSLLRGNKQGVWKAYVPMPAQTFVNERAHRSEFSFRQIAVFRTIQSAFLNELQAACGKRQTVSENKRTNALRKKHEANMPEIRGEVCISLFIEYAVLIGGLVERDVIYALTKLFTQDENRYDEVLFSDGGRVWLDIYVDKKSGSVTQNPTRQCCKLRRWYLDIPAMSLLSWAITKCHEKGYEAATLNFEKQLIERFKGTPLKSLSSVLETAALVWELDNPGAPGFLATVNKGALTSHPLPAHVITKLYQTSIKSAGISRTTQYDTQVITHQEQENADASPKKLHQLQSSEAGLFCHFEQDKQQLQILLSDLKANSEAKLRKSQVVANIKARVDSQVMLSPLMQVVTTWALHLLQKGTRFKHKLALSTVRIYLSRVTTCWLRYCDTSFHLNMDELEWTHFYHRITADCKGKKSLGHLMGRLEEFHWFLSEYFSVVTLSDKAFSVNAQQISVVRANYVNELEYAHLKQTIQKFRSSSTERMILLCIVILAYRTGLRKGEIIKLKISDFDIALESLLWVRSNQYGNNKSESAYRCIPLHLLLNSDELSSVKQYLALRKSFSEADNKAALAFYQPMTRNSKLASDYLDECITQPLKIICNDNTINFHTLRHSFVNNLYISLFINESNWLFSKQTYPRLNINLSDLAGYAHHESGKALYAIASLAGHASPVETLLSYCHFTNEHLHTVTRLLQNSDSDFVAPLLNMKQASYIRFYQRNKDQLETAMQRKLVRSWPETGDHLKLNLIGFNKSRKNKEGTHMLDSQPLAQNKQNAGSQTEQFQHLHGTKVEKKPDVYTIPLHIIEVLNAHEQGHTAEAIAKITGHSLHDVYKIISVATDVANQASAKGYSRFISRGRAANAYNEQGELKHPIAPNLPREGVMKTEALMLVEKIWQQLTNGATREKHQIMKALTYYANHVVASQTGIVLNTPKSAALLIQFFSMLVGQSRLFVRYQRIDTRQSKYDKVNQFLQRKLIQTSLSGTQNESLYSGKPFLCVNHPNSPAGHFKHSASLHYVMHVLKVVIDTE